MVARVVRAQVSRRSVLLGVGGAVALGALSACGAGGSAKGTTSNPPSGDRAVNWANHPQYLDYDEIARKYPSLERFTKQTGIRVSYSEEIGEDEIYYGTVQDRLRRGQYFGRDIVTLSDWMTARFIGNGWVREFDAKAIPNRKNLLPELAEVDFDPGRRKSLPWQSGYVGIGWNRALIPGGLRTLTDLWKPELKGRIEVSGEFRDTVGLIMSSQGKDISTQFSSSDFMNAVDELTRQVRSGQIRRVRGDAPQDDLVSGEALAVICRSSDIFALNAANEDRFGFTIPDSGGILWSDNLMIPNGSPNQENAEKILNFYYDPVNAAAVAAYVNHLCPVVGAQPELEKIDPDLSPSPLIFPTSADLEKVKTFRTLSAVEEKEFGGAFQVAIGN
jgi:spermidine/putrescine transport system substrate-binding protein